LEQTDRYATVVLSLTIGQPLMYSITAMYINMRKALMEMNIMQVFLLPIC